MQMRLAVTAWVEDAEQPSKNGVFSSGDLFRPGPCGCSCSLKNWREVIHIASCRELHRFQRLRACFRATWPRLWMNLWKLWIARHIAA